MANGSHIRAVGEELATGDTNAEKSSEETLILDSPVDEEEQEPRVWIDWEAEDEVAARRWTDFVLPTLFIAAIAAWTAFFGWVHADAMIAGATPAQWADWVTQWATPVLLVVALWLLAMRSSKKEAARFGDAARLLSDEARSLEERLSIVNRELSLAREFLGEQNRELDYLGRSATERLSTHADRLQTLIHENGEQLDAISTVSQTARDNMERLRDDLPVIANSTRDLTNRIGGAGREAQGQLEELVRGFERLNEFGKASEDQVVSLRNRIDHALASFGEQARELDDIADSRFAALREKSEEFRGELAAREVEALSAIRHRAAKLGEHILEARNTLDEHEREQLDAMQLRLDSLRGEATALSEQLRTSESRAAEIWQAQITGLRQRLGEAIEEIQRVDAIAIENSQNKLAGLRSEAEAVDANLVKRNTRFLEEMAARRKVFDEQEEEAFASLSDRLDRLDNALAERRAGQLAETQNLADRCAAITQGIERVAGIVASIGADASDAENRLDASSARLQDCLEESRQSVAEVRSAIDELTEGSVRLLELIRAGSEHSKTDLSRALGSAESRLIEVEQRGQELNLMLDASEAKGKALSDYVIQARDVSANTSENIEQLHGRFAESARAHQSDLERMQEALVALDNQSAALSARTQGDLRSAIAQLEDAATSVSQSIADTSRESIEALAETIGEESAKAVDKALSQHTREAVADLEQAAARASEVSRNAAVQLRDQLVKVDELAGNLEARVARARERAEEQAGNDFARRMALITESLNSNSIDIAKALASEVPDTTWASYLRGDRGIFTRRAVRLLDNVEARDIAVIYDQDPDFRDNVSHYIADFETMLRTMLSTRDGNALGVTLLGSDMGKLYVALAQAIERLRD